MSRIPSGSRPVISEPQPYNPRSVSGGSGPYPSFQRPQNAGEARPASPMRPVRSLRRAPSDGVSSGSNLRPSQQTHLAPIESSRRGSAEEDEGGMPYVPITPIDQDAPQGSGAFSDPWAADRSQRSEMLAQSSATALRPAGSSRGAGGPQSDKLRNVVGAFMSASKPRSEEPQRPTKSDDRARAARRARDRDIDVGQGDDSEQFAEIDGVLRKIKIDWPFVMDSDFSPSSLALSLLSSTPSVSLPEHPSLSSFLRLHTSLSDSLQAAVQSHFQSFAASLPAHAQYLAMLNRAQQQVRASKTSLKEARDGFAGKGKAELASIRVRERMLRDMLRILDVIDHLKQVPDQLESLIGDKRFLQAAILLVRSLKTINKPEMLDIGAVADLRAYLVAQESALVDILVEELHQHLYLKTFYSDSRWSAYASGQHDLASRDLETQKTASKSSKLPTNAPSSSRLSRYLSALSIKPSRDPLLDIDDSALSHSAPVVGHTRIGESIASISGVTSTATLVAPDPEVDSFGYMESLLEAGAALGKLGVIVDVMSQRVVTELYALVETTLEEVEERTEQRQQDQYVETSLPNGHGSRSLVESSFTASQSLRMAVALDAAGPPLHALALKDLFWTLYSKLAAVLEGHRVVFEVTRWISTRRDFKDDSLNAVASLSMPSMEVWKPMRQEVRTLLHDYLTDDDRTTFTRNQLMSVNEVLKDSKIARDKQKQMFKFADTDVKAMMNEIKEHNDALNKTLLASVPGLVNPATGESAQQALATALSTTDDRYSAGHHRRLIPANTFNISTLFQPTSAFLTRVADIIPPGYENDTDHFGGVLEDFVVRVFLPQLEEKVTASFQQAVGGVDAFTPIAQSSPGLQPCPVHSAIKVTALIQSLCSMLLTTPFHRENYSRLIVGVIVQYYQQCSTHFRDVASLPQSGGRNITKLATSASWAQRNDFNEISSKIYETMDSSPVNASDLAQREAKLAINLLDNATLPEKELIPSRRNLEQLGNLHHSLRWFITQLLDLKSIAEEPLSPGADADEPEMSSTLASIPEALDGVPKLPLTRAMAQRYDAIIQTYEQLASMVLFTMRLELRCRVICHVDAAMSKGNYRMDYDGFEPDPHILDLNANLVECEETASATLSDKDRRFLFQGLGSLTDTMLVVSARKLKSINAGGVQKVNRNILALQQLLRSLLDDPAEADFQRSTTFWNLYTVGPKDMMEGIRENGPSYSFEDYNAMLNLQCKVDQSQAAGSDLNSYLIDLHSLSMSGEGWDEA